jgi:hypothetical protein
MPHRGSDRATRPRSSTLREVVICSPRALCPAAPGTSGRSSSVNGPLVFLAASGLVGASATLGVGLLRLPSLVDLVLAWALIASTVVIATLLFTGAALGELAAWPVVAVNAAVAGLLALLRLRLRHKASTQRRPSLSHLRSLAAELRADRWLLVLLAAAGAEVLWRLVVAYLMPPYAADALWYHLTTVAGWLQEDRIGPSQLSIWSTVYPVNGELLFTWPALLLGTDTFVDAVQLPFAALGSVAVAGIGRTAGLSRRGATAAGCLFLLTPIVLSQSTASYTDLVFIAFFLSALHFSLRFLTHLREGQAAEYLMPLLLAGLAGGLALGTKTLGIVYVGVLSALVLAHLVAAGLTRRATVRRLGSWLVVFFVAVLALGSYRYIETWIRFGNPFFPVRIRALGIEFFHGRSPEWFLTPPRTEGAWWREVWGQWRQDYFFLVRPRFHAYSYDDRASGLGPLWSYLALPLVPVFAVRLLRGNRAVLLNLLLPVAAMFALQPYRWWSRFTMVLIAVGVIAIVAVVEALPRRWSNALKAAVLAVVAVGIAFPTLKIDGEFWAPRVLGVARIPASERTIGRIALPAFRWVDAVPPGTAIGVDTSAAFLGAAPHVFAYPLFGHSFEHRVYPLPQSGESALAQALTADGISYVMVRRGARLDHWIQDLALAGCALRVYDGAIYPDRFARAYRIVPCERLGAAASAAARP